MGVDLGPGESLVGLTIEDPCGARKEVVLKSDDCLGGQLLEIKRVTRFDCKIVSAGKSVFCRTINQDRVLQSPWVVGSPCPVCKQIKCIPKVL